MTTSTAAGPGRRSTQQWQPPSRPELVQRLNEEGAHMEIAEIVPLDEDSLLASARRSTGMDDFGADDWREPFQVLLKALRDEAALNLVGRIRTRSELLQLLEARLQIEDTYKRHPEIDDEEIVQPIVIVGQGRSGTSLLQNVLSADPHNGTTMHWELIFPCPPPESATYRSDPRIEKAKPLVDQWNRITPTLQSMHELAGDISYEDSIVLAMNFLAPEWFVCLAQVPSYDAYIYSRDDGLALAYHKCVLKLLQWRNPRKHWVLKDPMHLDRFEGLLKVYPDACFVWPHRDPARALASLINIIGTLHWGRSDEPFRGVSMELMTDPTLSAQRFAAVIDQIDSGVVPAGRIFNLLFKDLVADTIGTVEAMYEHFGFDMPEECRQAMVEYMRDNPRDARPPHRFSIGSDEALTAPRHAFAPYQQRFNIPSE